MNGLVIIGVAIAAFAIGLGLVDRIERRANLHEARDAPPFPAGGRTADLPARARASGAV